MLPAKQVSFLNRDSRAEGRGRLGRACCTHSPILGPLAASAHARAPLPRWNAVKQRIRAIKNIGKITKAMKMVAASKMRNAQVAVENSRGIVGPFVRLFGDYPGALWRQRRGLGGLPLEGAP